MRKLFILVLSFLLGSAIAQTQIPEAGFNNWDPNATNTYFEPAGGWWTTLNTLTSLGAPVTVSPTTDAHSGEYAAQLETKLWGAFLISGLLASGNFIMEEPYIQNGRPFTDTPSRFKAGINIHQLTATRQELGLYSLNIMLRRVKRTHWLQLFGRLLEMFKPIHSLILISNTT